MTEQNIEVEKKKSNKVIIIINIVAVLVVVGLALYYFFIFQEENDVKPRGFAAQDVTAEGFCEQWEERQASRGDMQLPEGAEIPEGAKERTGGQGDLMAEICEDGEVTEEEAQELEEMRENFKGMP